MGEQGEQENRGNKGQQGELGNGGKRVNKGTSVFPFSWNVGKASD